MAIENIIEGDIEGLERLNSTTEESKTTIKDLKKEISELKDKMVSMTKGTQEWRDAAQELSSKQEKLNDINKAAKGIYNDNLVIQENSIIALRELIKQKNAERNAMDMSSEAYKKATAELKTLNDKLREAGTSAGDWRANVGNYANSMQQAFSSMGVSLGALSGPLKLASGGVNTLAASFKSLIATPIGAAITAVVVAFEALSAVFGKVMEAIHNDEEAEEALSEAMSAFQPIIDGVSNAFDALGKVVVNVVGFVGDCVRSIREGIAAFTDFIGLTDGAAESVKKQNQTYKELAKSQNELTKNKREYQKLNANDKALVEQLREQATETTNNAEKVKLLTEAKKRQGDIDARNISLAKEELRIMKEKAKLTANSKEDNDKIAAQEAKINELTAQAAAGQRTLNKALSTAQKGASGGSGTNPRLEALKKEREEAEEIYKRSLEDNKTEIEKLNEKYDKELALLVKYNKDTSNLTKTYNDKLTEIETKAANDAAAKAKQVKEKQFKEDTELLTTQLTEYERIYNEKKDEIDDSDIELMSNDNMTEDGIDAYYDSVKARNQAEYDAYAEMVDNKIAKLEEWIEAQRKANNDTKKQEDEVYKLQRSKRLELNKLNKTQLQNENKRTQDKKKLYESELKSYSDMMGAMASLMDENTAAYKITASAKALIDTYSAANAVLAQQTGGLFSRIAAMTTVIATGLANLKSIWAVNTNGENSAAASTTTASSTDTSGAITDAPRVQESLSYTYTRSLQTEQEVEDMNRPIFASIVDIEDARNKLEIRESESTF